MLKLVYALAARLPLPVAHAIGALLGLVAYPIPSSLTRRARFNLSRCFPELGFWARERLLAANMMESGKALCELPILWSGGHERVARLVREWRGTDLLDEALAAGKGVIAASPHLGAWELAGLEYSRKYPITSLYRDQGGPWDDVMRAGRARFGAVLAPSDRSGMRRLLETLHAGGSIGVLPDQDPPRGSGVFAPFFGILAHSPVFAPRLARRTGATVLFIYAERLSFGRGYVMHVDPAPPEIIDPDDVRAVTALNAGVEACIRKFPTQYWWAYMRFRRRPPGEPGFYPW